jgi:enterobacterial common antigen flippase
MNPWRAVALTSATKIYWILGAMLSTIITAHVLGPQGRGVIAVATSSVTLFVAFGHLSLAYVVVYVVGRGGPTRMLRTVTGSLIAITLVVTVISWAVGAAIYVLSSGRAVEHVAPGLLVIAFASLPFLLWMENGNQLLVVIGDLRRLNLALFFGTSISLLIVITTVGVLKWGVAAALAATLIGSAVVVSLGLIRVLSETGLPTVSVRVARELLSGGLRLHMGAVGTFFFTNAGILLLNQFRPVAEAGYFQLALQMTTATQVVPMAVGIVAYSLVAKQGPDVAWRQQRSLVLQTMLYAAVAAAGSYMLAPIVIPLLAGRSFAPAVPLLRILALSVFGMSLATVMTPQWVGRGYLLRGGGLALAVALIGLVGNLMFVPRYGMTACAWVMVFSYSLHLVAQAAFAIWIDRRIPWRRSALAPLQG